MSAGATGGGPFNSTCRDADDRLLHLSIRRPPGDARDELAAFYAEFGPAGRAQGIPPASEQRRAEWLTRILENGSVDVIARDGSRIVGHATLVGAMDGTTHELAIFVGPDDRGVGIGNELIAAILDAGRTAGVERVELTVEHSNSPARRLYLHHDFEVTGRDSFVHEMAREL